MNSDQVTIITDRELGIKNAIRQTLPKAFHIFCYKHMADVRYFLLVTHVLIHVVLESFSVLQNVSSRYLRMGHILLKLTAATGQSCITSSPEMAWVNFFTSAIESQLLAQISLFVEFGARCST